MGQVKTHTLAARRPAVGEMWKCPNGNSWELWPGYARLAEGKYVGSVWELVNGQWVLYPVGTGGPKGRDAGPTWRVVIDELERRWPTHAAPSADEALIAVYRAERRRSLFWQITAAAAAGLEILQLVL